MKYQKYTNKMKRGGLLYTGSASEHLRTAVKRWQLHRCVSVQTLSIDRSSDDGECGYAGNSTSGEGGTIKMHATSRGMRDPLIRVDDPTDPKCRSI